MAKNRIITISRQYGSGGRQIGLEAASMLGIKCYDRDILREIARKSGFAEEFIKHEGEYINFLSAALSPRTAGPTCQDKIWIWQQEFILKAASEGSCVIIGRCADYILRGKADCLKVYIHASEEKRIARIKEEHGGEAKDILKTIKMMDKRRKDYLRFYTDIKWGAANQYDITLDSGEIGIAKSAQIIASLY